MKENTALTFIPWWRHSIQSSWPTNILGQVKFKWKDCLWLRTRNHDDVLWDEHSNNGAPVVSCSVLSIVMTSWIHKPGSLTSTLSACNIDALLGFETQDTEYAFNYAWQPRLSGWFVRIDKCRFNKCRNQQTELSHDFVPRTCQL